MWTVIGCIYYDRMRRHALGRCVRQPTPAVTANRDEVQKISGFLAFWTALKLLAVSSHPIELPALPELSLEHLALSGVAACGACLVAGLYLLVRRTLNQMADRFVHPHRPIWLVVIGSALLGLLLAAVPMLRFSGHESVGLLPELALTQPATFFLCLTLLKIVATNLSLTAGWLGGEFFPLAFIGSLVGTTITLIIPDMTSRLRSSPASPHRRRRGRTSRSLSF